MLIVITGNGKGKTTSSLGMITRALGQGLKCCVIQVIKNKPETTGEYRTFKKLGLEWENWGEGFTWEQSSLEETRKDCEKCWDSFKSKVESGAYEFIVLDEFTYVLEYGLLNKEDVLSYLGKIKDSLHIVITGRGADEDLVALADTVSEVNEIKHHFNSNGFKAVKGIEF